MTEEAGISLAAQFSRSENVVGRRIADEYVLVPIVRSGADLDSIYHLNRVGAFIWERLDGRTQGGEIVQAVTEEFDVSEAQAAKEYREFLAQLESIGVIARAPGASGIEGAPRGATRKGFA